MARKAGRDDTAAAAGPAAEGGAVGRAFTRLESGLTLLRKLVVSLAALFALVVVVPLLVVEVFRDQVVIEPIAVPPDLVSLGYTGDVVANRLWDAIQQVKEASRSSKELRDVLPSSRQVEFAFPDSGISFDSVIHHARRFFDVYETRIGGEIVCAGACSHETMQLRLRVLDGEAAIITLPPAGAMTDDAYFRSAAAEVLRRLDPFIAASYLAESDPERAVTVLRRLVRVGHADAKWAHNLVGLLLKEDGELDAAIAQFEASLRLDPEFSPALTNLAFSLVEKGDRARARTLLQRVLELDPGQGIAHEGLARIALAEEDRQAAIRSYRRAAQLDPDSPRPVWQIGNIHAEAGDAQRAIASFNEALEIDPSYTPAYSGLAFAYLQLGNYPAVERIHRDLVELQPDEPAAHGELGVVLVARKDFAAAAESFRRAAELDPANARWQAKLGDALREGGRIEEAIAAFHRAIALDGELTEVYFGLGRAYLEADRRREARAAFEAFLEANPATTSAPLARAYLRQLGG